MGGVFARRARLVATKLIGSPRPVPHLRPQVSYPDEQETRVTADDIWMEARLPQSETLASRTRALCELERARGLYQFTSDPGMPAYVKDLPAHEAFSSQKDLRMEWDIATMVVGLGLGDIEARLDRSRLLASYKDFFSDVSAAPQAWPVLKAFEGFAIGADAIKPPLPKVVERYDTDEELAPASRRVNPFLLRRCDVIPDHFPVDQAIVGKVLPNGPDLDTLRRAGRLYLLDLAILEGIPPRRVASFARR